jgi:ABC-type polysaccharide/polyol phosphate transport system ATPase subunit
MSEDRAVVIVSHSEAQMRALSTKMLWLGGDGKRAVGEVDEIFALYNQ